MQLKVDGLLVPWWLICIVEQTQDVGPIWLGMKFFSAHLSHKIILEAWFDLFTHDSPYLITLVGFTSLLGQKEYPLDELRLIGHVSTKTWSYQICC